jgi:phosphate transport system substrate-binding protein
MPARRFALPAPGASSRQLRLLSIPLALLLLVLTGGHTPARADYAQIEGSGSTWSEVILRQWISDVSPSGIRASYNGVGSSIGRKDFSNFTNDFAISEIPYQGTDEYGQPDTANGREYAYMPIVAGGTAFTYHLEQAGKLVTGIRLSGDTIAKVFTNQITSWADPAIKADNNGRLLPDTPIVPVVRSDGSGTTAQFTTWLNAVHPTIWQKYFGRAGLTSYYPKPSGTRMISASGSDQVMNTIAAKSGNGTIGYVEYSYPVNKGYPVVKVLNAAGFYVEPTQYNVAVALTKATINQDPTSQLYLTQVLDAVYTNPDPRAYPLSSYSYMVLPTGASDRRLTTAKRQSLVDLMFYSLCDGQSQAGPFGYSPLPLNLVQAGFDQLKKLQLADHDVDLTARDVTKCNNPTFVADDLSRNKLAEVAPAPDACSAAGAGPCDVVVGAATGATTGAATGAATGTTAGTTGAAAGTTTGTAVDAAGAGTGTTDGVAVVGPAGGDAVTYDPVTGLAVGVDAGVSGAGVSDAFVTGAVSTTVAARPVGGGLFFGGLATAELVAVILVPGLLALRARRRGAAA